MLEGKKTIVGRGTKQLFQETK